MTAPAASAIAQRALSPLQGGILLAGLLDELARVRLPVTGGCMAPALEPGERVILESCRKRRPRFGDVVLVRQREGLRLHRLVWAPPGPFAWRTQADRAGGVDPRIRPEDVLGTVVAIEGPSNRRPRRRRLALASLTRATRLRLGWR